MCKREKKGLDLNCSEEICTESAPTQRCDLTMSETTGNPTFVGICWLWHTLEIAITPTLWPAQEILFKALRLHLCVLFLCIFIYLFFQGSRGEQISGSFRHTGTQWACGEGDNFKMLRQRCNPLLAFINSCLASYSLVCLWKHKLVQIRGEISRKITQNGCKNVSMEAQNGQKT